MFAWLRPLSCLAVSALACSDEKPLICVADRLLSAATESARIWLLPSPAIPACDRPATAAAERFPTCSSVSCATAARDSPLVCVAVNAAT